MKIWSAPTWHMVSPMFFFFVWRTLCVSNQFTGLLTAVTSNVYTNVCMLVIPLRVLGQIERIHVELSLDGHVRFDLVKKLWHARRTTTACLVTNCSMTTSTLQSEIVKPDCDLLLLSQALPRFSALLDVIFIYIFIFFFLLYVCVCLFEQIYDHIVNINMPRIM